MRTVSIKDIKKSVKREIGNRKYWMKEIEWVFGKEYAIYLGKTLIMTDPNKAYVENRLKELRKMKRGL